MQVVDGTEASSTAVSEAPRTGVSAKVRAAVVQARKHAAAGQWHELIMMLDGLGSIQDHPKLLVERLRAGVELNDDAQIMICTNAAKALANVDERVILASALISSNRPLEANSIILSLPDGGRTVKQVRVAHRILSAMKGDEEKSRLREFIGHSEAELKGYRPILHRFPGDNDEADCPQSNLDIVRLQNVPVALDERIREIWTTFDKKLDSKPFPFIREYQDVFVNGQGQVWAPNGDAIKSYGVAVPSGINQSEVPVFEEAFSLIRQNRGYYEWLADRLATLSWRLAPDTPNCPILVCDEHYKLALATLTPLGLPEEQIVAVSGIVFCRKLYHGSSSTAALVRKGAYHHSFGKLIELAATQVKDDLPKRFYISRRDSSRRSMTNEAEFEAGMVAHGFKPIILSELSLLEKINLFRNAEAVVGAHGAGLAHLLFAKPGLRVVEIIPGSMSNYSQMGVRACFTLMSRVFGLNHTVVLHKMNPASFEWSSDPNEIARLV